MKFKVFWDTINSNYHENFEESLIGIENFEESLIGSKILSATD